MTSRGKRVLRPLVLRPAPPVAVGVLVAVAAIAVETLLVRLLEIKQPGEAFEPIYLFGVLVVSAVWGLGLAVATSLASAIVLTYLRTHTAGQFLAFDITNDVIVVIFLFVALFTSLIAGVAREHAVRADKRSRDADVAAGMASRSRAALGVLARQQEALRRVATLVARGVDPSEVFAVVSQEMARCLNAETAEVLRYESDSAAIVVGCYAEPGKPHLPVGERVTLEGDNVAAMVLRTRRAARMDNYDDASGSLGERMRKMGVRCRVGVPIVVGGRQWGMAIVGSSRPEPLPPDTELRVGDFADLVATAIANAATRAELIASRARIVTAADDARRRFERDLHDGAQQRLVSLALQARFAEQLVLDEQTELRRELSDLVSGLTGVSMELREISRGIHPAILSRGGLGPALKSLARRSAVPVGVQVTIDRRLPSAVEIASYYVAAEALTNAVKHARASQIDVRAEVSGDNALRVSIQDDGIGGAEFGKGSGLIGLKDRVEALGGRLKITSLPGSGTSLEIAIRLDNDAD